MLLLNLIAVLLLLVVVFGIVNLTLNQDKKVKNISKYIKKYQNGGYQ